MTQLSMGVMACQTESKFQAAYNAGVHKSEYWETTLEDSLDLIAKVTGDCSHNLSPDVPRWQRCSV